MYIYITSIYIYIICRYYTHKLHLPVNFMFPAFQACEKARKLRPQLRLLRNWATLRLPAPGATWQKWFFNGDLMGFYGIFW